MEEYYENLYRRAGGDVMKKVQIPDLTDEVQIKEEIESKVKEFMYSNLMQQPDVEDQVFNEEIKE